MIIWEGWLYEIIFEPRDLRVGAFWDSKDGDLHLYVCPVPTLALHVILWRRG